MRGLTVFISDIRNCQSREGEKKRVDKELAHIRKKFTSGQQLSAYDKKKYMWKLLYCYMLGYEVDFGHMEAVALIGSPKYQEKQVGYLATSLLLNEDSELLRLIINCVRNDLTSRNENFITLALISSANMGNKEFSEALIGDVEKILFSNTARTLVRKKAALCLLRMYRKDAEVLSPDPWAEKLGSLLEENNLGFLTSVMSLVGGIIQTTPKGWESIAPKACKLLSRMLINKDYTSDYTYYGIPSPWLQCKILRLLQYFPPIDDPGLKSRLVEVLKLIISGTDVTKNVNKNNASHAILFEAINLVVQMDSDTDLMAQCVSLLGRFIAVREPNIKYLGLETMGRVALIAETGEHIRKHQQTIIESLKDPDISIRRRALDLLYAICDHSNAQEVVRELLDYLVSADFIIREELVLKIAILAEKFATRLSWYLDIVLELIAVAGDFVSDAVWHRVIHIVTNNEDLQQYAAETAFKNLSFDIVHEKTLLVGAYILGEYGYLISTQPGKSPRDQFNLISKRYATSSPGTKALLLSVFAKLVNVCEDLRPDVFAMYDQHIAAFDVELQQRSTEYSQFFRNIPRHVLQSVWELMPAFPERESTLLKRLAEKQPAQWAANFDRTDSQTNGDLTEAAERATSASMSSKRRSTATPGADLLDMGGTDTSSPSASRDLLGGGGEAPTQGATQGSLLDLDSSPPVATASAELAALSLGGPSPAAAASYNNPYSSTNPFGSNSPVSATTYSSQPSFPSSLSVQPAAAPPPASVSPSSSLNVADLLSGIASPYPLAPSPPPPSQQPIMMPSHGIPLQPPSMSMSSSYAPPPQQPLAPTTSNTSLMSNNIYAPHQPSLASTLNPMPTSYAAPQQQPQPPAPTSTNTFMSTTYATPNNTMFSTSSAPQPSSTNIMPTTYAPQPSSLPTTMSSYGGGPPQPSQQQPPAIPPPSMVGFPPSTTSLSSMAVLPPSMGGAPTSPSATPAQRHKELFLALVVNSEGVLYEDDTLQVAVKSEFHGAMGRLMLMFGNKANLPLSSFRANIPTVPYLSVAMSQTVAVVGARSQIQLLLSVECIAPFQDAPKLDIVYMLDSQSITHNLKLPVVMSKFNEPVSLSAEDFMKRWKMINGPPLEYQGVGKCKEPVNVAGIEKAISGLRVGVLKGVDPNPANILAVGVFCSKGSQTPVMLRIETNMVAQAYRITIKTGNNQVTASLLQLITAQL
eukprot:CAMPEP_0184653344 /NCGR_PEP_ID=MMETSP0308-20130426/11042_1 /TAXON_ID=38269 /ORGANISM="Gloeochaete witrockiana, Strain SAG 46.84" /LENGTH=1204 /DNA_ID=CAMNT_0027088731 /DNA_START=109 /DNA_END=3723 /DNA_ORIENTATION=+